MKQQKVCAPVVAILLILISHVLNGMETVSNSSTIMNIFIGKKSRLTAVEFSSSTEDLMKLIVSKKNQLEARIYDLKTRRRVDGPKDHDFNIKDTLVGMDEINSKNPLCEVKHKQSIVFAAMNQSATKVVTASEDGNIKVSSLLQPMIFICGHDKIVVPYTKQVEKMFNTSKVLKAMFEDVGNVNAERLVPLHCVSSRQEFRHVYQCMALVAKASTKWQLQDLDDKTVCTLLALCNYLDIQNDKMNAVDHLAAFIASRYKKINTVTTKQLPSDLQNIIAQHKIARMINYRDSFVNPVLSRKNGRHPILYIAFSILGDAVITQSSRNHKKAVDIRTKKNITTFNTASYFNHLTVFNGTELLSRMGRFTVPLVVSFNDKDDRKCILNHTSAVTSIAMSMDGTKFITKSEDGAGKVWDINTQACLYTFENLEADVTAIAIKNGLAVVGHDKGVITLWDCITGKRISKAKIHDYCVTCIAFNHARAQIAVGFADGTVQVWNVNDAGKKELLQNVTIEQANLIMDKIYPVRKCGSAVQFTEDSKEYQVFLSIPPNARYYLCRGIKILLLKSTFIRV